MLVKELLQSKNVVILQDVYSLLCMRLEQALMCLNNSKQFLPSNIWAGVRLTVPMATVLALWVQACISKVILHSDWLTILTSDWLTGSHSVWLHPLHVGAGSLHLPVVVSAQWSPLLQAGEDCSVSAGQHRDTVPPALRHPLILPLIIRSPQHSQSQIISNSQSLLYN